MTEDHGAAVAGVFARLEQAWNDADGAAFGEPFTPDADFVDIRGTHHRGAGAIAGGHDGIFRSVYRGSTIRYEVTGASPVADGCVLALVTATLDAPEGPLQGTHHSTITAVLVEGGDGWRVRAFHNTLVTA